MKVVLALAAATCLSCGAGAAPVHMKCQFESGTDKGPFDVQLNEEARIVKFTSPTGGTHLKPAVFTSKTVVFSSFVVDRSNLSVQRIVFKRPPVDHGKCRLNNIKAAVQR